MKSQGGIYKIQRSGINQTGSHRRMLYRCGVVLVAEVGRLQEDEAVTVERVHEALEKDFGDPVDLGRGNRERSPVEGSLPDRP